MIEFLQTIFYGLAIVVVAAVVFLAALIVVPVRLLIYLLFGR